MKQRFLDIYNQKNFLKIIIWGFAGVFVMVSLFYTQWLAKRLADREERLIDLYAKTLQYVVKADLDEEQTFLVQEVINANESVPVILVRDNKIIDSRNIYIPESISAERKQKILERELAIMREQHKPVVVDLGQANTKNYVYFRDSDILQQLRFFPYIQIAVIFAFGYLTYLAFSYSRRAEQNRVWVGLAKETAHQLGTPISSLLAWVEYLEAIPELKKDNVTMELTKDIKRLETVTARFSSIGSEPTLQLEDVYFILLGVTNYLQRRISTKVKIEVKSELPRGYQIPLNRYLFEWVIENLCKNAVDAMPSGAGKIKISLIEAPEGDVVIDIADNGKGMSKAVAKKIFNPGYTTKKRGWGLGLTLAKRIIEQYHRGKLFIKSTEPEQGTTFRIELRAAAADAE